eukprot:403333135
MKRLLDIEHANKAMVDQRKQIKKIKFKNLEDLQVQLLNQSVEEVDANFLYFTQQSEMKDKFMHVAHEYHQQNLQSVLSAESLSAQFKLEIHQPIHGYNHRYMCDQKSAGLDFKCALCSQKYIKHQRSHLQIRNIRNDEITDKLLKRQHSFHEHELVDLKKTLNDDLQTNWRFMKINKNLVIDLQKTFNCDICYLDVNMNDIAVLDCAHYFCRTCLTDYYNVMINQAGRPDNIKCPNIECKKQIRPALIEQLSEPKSYQKFLRMIKNQQVVQSNNKKFCPYPDCEEIIIGKKGLKETTCTKCKNQICYSCQMLWHQGQSCTQAQKQLYQGWIYKVGAHKCPKCQIPIENPQGCLIVSCLQCHCEWCWVCGLYPFDGIHKYNIVSPFSCKMVPSTTAKKIQSVAMFIIGFFLIPIVLLLAGLGGPFYYIVIVVQEMNRSGEECPWFMWIIFFLVGIISILFAIGVAVILGPLLCGLLTVPALIAHTYFFVKSCSWWKKQNRTRFIQTL